VSESAVVKPCTLMAVAMLSLASAGCVHIVREQELLPGGHYKPPAPATPPELTVEAADGSALRGYAFTGDDRPSVIVYFGGNGELITADSSLGEIARREGVDLYAVNYRGFSPSDGTASIQAIHDDSVRVFDAIATRPEIRGRPIVVYGYSIGTVAALTVATSRPAVAGIVLQGAPSAAAAVVPKMRRALPWYARPWVRLRAAPEVAAWKPQPIDLAPALSAPLLSIHGTKDRVIAIQFGRELFDAAGSKDKTWCPIEGGEHVGLWSAKGDEAGACLGKFLGEVGR
jgi:alpha-beta hydrolase superfamily lysophospholipase